MHQQQQSYIRVTLELLTIILTYFIVFDPFKSKPDFVFEVAKNRLSFLLALFGCYFIGAHYSPLIAALLAADMIYINYDYNVANSL